MTEEKCFICGEKATYVIDRYIGGGCTTPLYQLCDKHGVRVLNYILDEWEKND